MIITRKASHGKEDDSLRSKPVSETDTLSRTSIAFVSHQTVLRSFSTSLSKNCSQQYICFRVYFAKNRSGKNVNEITCNVIKYASESADFNNEILNVSGVLEILKIKLELLCHCK